MADDGVIRVGTEVDVSNLRAGMQQAQAAVQAATANMTAAYEQLGKSAAMGNLQASATLKEYEQALASAQSRLISTSQAVTTLAASERAESTALKGSVSARMAASAELRIFEGNLTGSTRAAGALLASLPGLSSALQVAFPVFGAIALTEVVVTLGKKLYEAFDIGGERARKLQEDIRNVSLEIERSSTSLNVQIDKLQQEQARLEHRPFNGIKLALDEAAESADRLIEQLDRIEEREKKVIEGMAASAPQQALGLGSGTAYEQTMLSEHTRHLGDSKTVQDALNESTSYYISLQTRLKDLESKQDIANQQSEGVGLDFTNEINATKQLISWQQQEQANIKATIALNEQQASTQKARDAHGAAVLDNAAQIAQMQGIEAEFEKLNAAKARFNGVGLSAGEGASFWSQYLTTFRDGSEESKRVLENYIKFVDENHKKLTASIATLSKEQNRDLGLPPSMAEVDKWLREQAEDALRTGERWRDYNEQLAKASQIQIENAQSLALAKVSAMEASGSITKLTADHQIAAIHAKDYADKLKVLNAELEKLKAEAKTDPNTGLADPKNAAQQQQVQNQIAQVKGQQQTSGINDQSAIQQQIAQPYLKAFNEINQGWLEVQNRMLFSTRNLSQAFAKMGQQIFISIVDNMERAALFSIEKSLAMRLAHEQMVTSNVTTDKVGAATSIAISKQTALEQQLTDAKKAFTSTYATVSGWPVVGPVLAPVLASAAFVAVAAFEEGTGYVPRDGMAYLHQGEAVVPAPTMDQLRGSGEDRHLTLNNTTNINGHAERDVIRAIQRNPHEIAKALQKHARQTGRA